MNSRVILVDEQNEVLGEEEKLIAHQKGLLHRAFSVMLYRRRQGKLAFLLQQRHAAKYHSGGLWTNTCCSHPQPGEATPIAARRRLFEETGIDVPLQEVSVFRYIAHFANGLVEHEVDHVFIGEFEDFPQHFDPEEIEVMKWVELEALKRELDQRPYLYTPWFGRVLSECELWLARA